MELPAKCDRCKRPIYAPYANAFVMDGTFWSRFAKQGEKLVCSDCMRQDPRYNENYK